MSRPIGKDTYLSDDSDKSPLLVPATRNIHPSALGHYRHFETRAVRILARYDASLERTRMGRDR
jgi:hypothetical protein